MVRVNGEGEGKGEQYTGPPMRQETSVGGEIREPNGGVPSQAEDQGESDENEQDDGQDLDNGKPELEFGEIADVSGQSGHG